ncbi:RNA-directed DNA polymerase, eukaryota, reverse transcriptase zinc-binding domain protein [Tanacetum coccineum]
MRDPDPKNPNSVPPARGSDDVIKPKRASRSGGNDVKLAPKYTFSISKPAVGSGRKGNKKSGIRGKELKRIVEDVEIDDAESDGSDVRNEDEEVGGEINDVDVGRSGNEGVEGTNVVGDMPVPFSENIILNPGGNVSSEPRIDIRKSGNGDVSGMVWPSLNEVTRKDKGSNGVGNNDMDTDMSNGASGSKPLSFVSTMQEEGSKKWDLTLVGYFVGLKMSYAEISGHLRRMWRTRDLAEIITNECGLYFLKFRSIEGMNYVLENGPWLVEGKPLFVQKWEAGLCMEKPEPTRVPLWVKIMNVPLEAWNTHGYEEKMEGRVNYKKQDVSNGVDESLEVNEGWQNVRRPVRNVASTSNNIGQQNVVGNDGGYRGGYNVRGRGGMYGKGNMNGRGGLSGGRGGMYQSENNGGTGTRFVPVRNAGKRVDSVHVMEDNGVGRSADKGKETEKAKNGSVKKVIERDEVVENSFSALNDEIFEIGGEEWVQAKSKINLAVELGVKVNMIAGLRWRIAKLQKDIVNRNTCVSRVASEEAEIRCVALMKKEGITRTQAFGKIYEETYREELIKIDSLQIEKQKAEVELFFYSGEVLTEEIRNDWTDEMVMQYEGLMGEKVNKIMNESLQGSQMECMDDEVAEDMSGTAKFMARNEVADVVDGNDAEMQETHLRKKVVNNVCNEVFGAWDWVSNSVDSKKGCRIAVGWDPAVFRPMLISQTSQVMHFLVKRNMDNKEIYVSFVYGEINAMGRRELWKNLKDFNNIAGNFPWVLLGDFNVILSYNENSRGIRINNMGVYEFRDCVEFLNIEDVKITGLFFTWIQKRRDPNNGILKKLDRVMGNGKFVDAYVNAFANFLPFGVSDHSPAVLVFPEVKSRKNRAFRFLNYLTEKKEFITTVRDNWNVDIKGYAMFILAKRLKLLKKHMRDLNKKNGDVCEKVKSLKVELDRVQEALSNDPSSVHFREEELVYAEAYRKAVSDEELLLKQKSKIQWLKEGDFNSAYFHNIVKGRKFFGKCDVVYPIEDHENLFTNKLDPETAEELVRPVSDDEIKKALFDIEDNKASGLDGYTSKFFKSAWSVVGKDTCSV